MVKVGIVGYGFMGKMHAQCYKSIVNAQVTAIADAELDRREEAKARLGCETYSTIYEMLSSADIDAVDICMPTYLHEEHVIAAAHSGKQVICEKPMALTVESCNRMINAVRHAGVELMVGHLIRFWPEYQVIKEIVDSGKYGRVHWVSARRLSPRPEWVWQNWLADQSKSGGVILDLQIHDLDYIMYLIGSPQKVLANVVKSPTPGFESVLTLGWEHKCGASSYAEGSIALAPDFPFNMAILVACEKATIRYDSSAVPSLMVYPFEGIPFAPDVPNPALGISVETQGNISALGGYYNELDYFVNCIKNGRSPRVVTPESACEAVRLCLAVRESAEKNRAISL